MVKCIHKYVINTKTNPQPPGVGDFLRGTIALYELSKKYGYELYFDNNHPFFSYLENSPYIVSNNSEAIELIPPIDYDNIYNSLVSLFESSNDFTVLTNAFYKEDISIECKKYLQNILIPSVEVKNKIEDIFTNFFKISINESYKVIHLRFGDRFIHNNEYDNDIYELYYNKIQNLLKQNNETKYILISDSSQIANKLKENIDELYYWNNSKIHLGDLRNNETNLQGTVYDTMVDFFILSKATEIISNGSGFSRYLSRIFDICYTGI